VAGFIGDACVIPANPSGGRAPSVREVVRDEPPVPNVLVDQVGYLPGSPKLATVKTTARTPLDWQVVGPDGHLTAAGKTQVVGHDRASGDDVHIVDFSAVRSPGIGYTVRVGSDSSHPFTIGADIYRKLKYDALGFFYQNRSGIDIAMPYAGDARWARPAGHLGDRSVPCASGAACGYRLDVSGGWYDAGDHGKYVVNGGIALWTLLSLYERNIYLGKSASDFADGTMNIPERHNGVPDLLDEARWEMEWMLKMQVPPGNPLAGMAHHKIHDRSWTTLALAPHNDEEPRFLHPPSTAATLNLAAVAAQAARIWKDLDGAFAARCLAAAERAYAAALAHPALFAPGGQTAGGGPYDDSSVGDEVYWAAAELFITTGRGDLRDAVMAAPHFGALPTDLGERGIPEQASAMTWQKTQALGTISLAIVPNRLAPADRDAIRARVRAAADVFVATLQSEGYRTPFKPGPKGYPWGSNSDVANNLIVIALAGDLSGDRRYSDAVAIGIGYLLGRNPLDKCFVSGYGARPLLNPHHRFWAHQFNFRFPPPPPGVLSGGPNSGLQDPTIRSLGNKMARCAPQTCYVDHIESWSSNEVAINWNAPLVWVAAVLDEVAHAQGNP
jgi:endoglucanase